MTDSQLVTGILNNDERAWRHICRNMKAGFMAKVYSMNLHGKLTPCAITKTGKCMNKFKEIGKMLV